MSNSPTAENMTKPRKLKSIMSILHLPEDAAHVIYNIANVCVVIAAVVGGMGALAMFWADWCIKGYDATTKSNLLVPRGRPNPEWVVPPNPNKEAAKLEHIASAIGKPVGVDEIPADAIRLYVGTALYWFDLFPVCFLRQGTEDLITIDSKDGGILLSAKFFDSEGKIACEIVDNQFHVNPANYTRPDFQSDKSRLIVHNSEGREVLDVEFVNPKALRLSGDFYMRDGKRAVLKNGAIQLAGSEWWYGGAVRAGYAGITFVYWIDVPPGTQLPTPEGSQWIEIRPLELLSKTAPADPCFVLRLVSTAKPTPGKPHWAFGDRIGTFVALEIQETRVGEIEFKSELAVLAPDQAAMAAVGFQNDRLGIWKSIPGRISIDDPKPAKTITYWAASDPPSALNENILAGAPDPEGVIKFIYTFHAIRYTPENGPRTTCWFACRYDAKTGETEFLDNFSNIKYRRD